MSICLVEKFVFPSLVLDLAISTTPLRTVKGFRRSCANLAVNSPIAESRSACASFFVFSLNSICKISLWRFNFCSEIAIIDRFSFNFSLNSLVCFFS